MRAGSVPTSVFQPASIVRSPRGHGNVAMVGGYMMLIYSQDGGGASNDGGIEFWDVSDPRQPTLFRRYEDADTHGLREAHGFGFAEINGRTFLAAQSVLGVQFWDVTDPGAITFASEIDLPGINAGDYDGAWWVFWQAPWVYVAGVSQGLFVIDARDPQVGTFDAATDPALRVRFANDVATIAEVTTR